MGYHGIYYSMEEKDRMKRLLCVLMVMVVAVLLVPTIASGTSVGTVKIVYQPVEAEQAGCLVSYQNDNGIWKFTVEQEASGYVFDSWTAIWSDKRTSEEKSWSSGIDASQEVDLFAYFVKKEAPEPEPEPVVVVEEKKPEEKKPEEPHVHAEEWVPGTPATCTSTGLTDGSKCKWCGEVLKAQTVIPKIDHVYSMWVPNGSGKHFASCLYCGNKIDAACEKVQLQIKSTSGAAVILCPVCGDCNGATATAVKGLKVGEGAPYRGTLRVWNIDAGDNNKYLAVSFDRFGKVMQPEGEVSITLPDDMKGTTAGIIGADGSVTPVQESNGTLKLDFTGSQVVVLKGN